MAVGVEEPDDVRVGREAVEDGCFTRDRMGMILGVAGVQGEIAFYDDTAVGRVSAEVDFTPVAGFEGS